MTLREKIHWHYKNTPWFRRLVRRFKDQTLSGLARFGLALIRALPFDVAMRLAPRAGALIYRCMPELRELADRHLQIAFGTDFPRAERERIARESLVNAARMMVEIAHMDWLRPRLDEYVTLVGTEVVEEFRRRGSGAIVVTGHFGNWEIMAAYFARQGFDIAAVARRFYVDRINQMLMDFRTANGVEVILRDDTRNSARQLLSILKRGGILAMIVDQDTHAQSLSIPFFGRPARTPVAPVALALRRNLPLTAAFIERLPEGGHRITVDPLFDLPRSGDAMQDLRSGLEIMSRRIEEQVRRCPEQWMWWHKRWEHPPVAHLDLDGKFQYTERQSASPPGATERDIDEAGGRSAGT